MGGNDQSRPKKIEENLKDFRVKIFEIRQNIVYLKEAHDEKEKRKIISKFQRVVQDLEKQADDFTEEYIKEISTHDAFIALIQAITKAHNVDTSTSLKEIEDLDKKFSTVEKLLLDYLRKHFGHIKLEIKQVKVRGNLGGEYGGATGEVTMIPKKKDVYD